MTHGDDHEKLLAISSVGARVCGLYAGSCRQYHGRCRRRRRGWLWHWRGRDRAAAGGRLRPGCDCWWRNRWSSGCCEHAAACLLWTACASGAVLSAAFFWLSAALKRADRRSANAVRLRQPLIVYPLPRFGGAFFPFRALARFQLPMTAWSRAMAANSSSTLGSPVCCSNSR